MQKLVFEARSLTAISNIRGRPAEIFTDLETRISVFITNGAKLLNADWLR